MTNALLTGIGDSMAQIIAREPGQKWDFERSARFVFYGAAVAPLMGGWNALLERRIPMIKGTPVKARAIVLARRIVADQLIMFVQVLV